MNTGICSGENRFLLCISGKVKKEMSPEWHAACSGDISLFVLSIIAQYAQYP